MQRLRSLRPALYTQVPNAALDNLPDLNSAGLLAHYLRHNDDFNFNLKDLVRNKPGVGEQTVYRARRTLITFGYIVQVVFKHSYRGRFCTDIYRATEPHTIEDLAVLTDRYTPGRTAVIVDDDGNQRTVTVIAATITSANGEMRLTGQAAELSTAQGMLADEHPTDPAKPQVAPDRGFPGTGQPGTGRPGLGQPGLGNPRSLIEEQSEHQGEHPDPDGELAAEPSEQHRHAATALLELVDLTPVSAHESQRWQIRDAVALAFAAGYRSGPIAAYLRAKVAQGRTVRYVLGAFTADRLPDIAAFITADPLPPPCGGCDARPTDPVSARVIWIDDHHSEPCPNCHPSVTRCTG